MLSFSMLELMSQNTCWRKSWIFKLKLSLENLLRCIGGRDNGMRKLDANRSGIRSIIFELLLVKVILTTLNWQRNALVVVLGAGNPKLCR